MLKNMTGDIRDRIAVLMLSILPFYHKKIFRLGHCGTGMQAAQYRVLWTLMREGILPMSELGKLLYISKPYMTNLVDQLIREGHVERIPGTRDRRVVNISITPAGIKHLHRMGMEYRADTKTILSGLDDRDLEDLCQSLETLHTIFNKIT
jgi:DNA-binding MarR family transcriptional regulator